MHRNTQLIHYIWGRHNICMKVHIDKECIYSPFYYLSFTRVFLNHFSSPENSYTLCIYHNGQSRHYHRVGSFRGKTLISWIYYTIPHCICFIVYIIYCKRRDNKMDEWIHTKALFWTALESCYLFHSLIPSSSCWMIDEDDCWVIKMEKDDLQCLIFSKKAPTGHHFSVNHEYRL